ncbi:MAG: hypothetical protein JWL84_963 [Rhodospirillales bacterium]|jgi:hypothetical protein|nr:hypothetical protein [Rhodospirillales bacterium]
MIRCVPLWTREDGNSHFDEGVIDLEPGQRGDVLSGRMATTTISFEETAPGGAFAWHTAPVRQLVITLSGTLDFQTREGKHFLIRPGEIRRYGWQRTQLEADRRPAVATRVCRPSTRDPGAVSREHDPKYLVLIEAIEIRRTNLT